MGQANTIMNIHICGLDLENKDIYKEQIKTLNILFPKEDKKNSTSDYKVKYCEKPKYNAFIYSDKNTQNFKLINETIQSQINMYNGLDKKAILEKQKKEGFKNHVIILFVYNNSIDKELCEEFSKEDTIDNLNEYFPLLIFIFKDNDRDNFYYKDIFFDFSYIYCVNLSKINLIKVNEKKVSNADLAALYLKHLLYKNYDSYFSERGHKLIDEIDPLSNSPMTGIYLPIILIGNPGVGKSTFINIINGYRISRATSSDDPVTSKSSIYDVRIPGNDNNDILIENEQLNQEAFIRFIDTPGFDLEKDIDTGMNAIKQIFEDFKEGKERVPVILYFMNPVGRNSTKDKIKEKKMFEILKYISENKVKVIFVITHIGKNERWKKKASFLQKLKEKKLEKLIENDESNIIKCQLVGDNAYGIKEIFKKIYQFTNFIEDNDYKQTEVFYGQSLIEELKKRKTFDEKLSFIKTKTDLFDEFKSKEDIITYANKKSNLLIASMTTLALGVGAIPIPFVDATITASIIGTTISKIGKFYGYVWKKILKGDLFSIYKGELYTKKENDDSQKVLDYKTFLKLIGEIFFKSFIMTIALNADDILKIFWGIGSIIGMVIGAAADSFIVGKYAYNAKKYFESKCAQDDGTLFFYTRCSEYEVIFKRFKQFDNYELIYPPDKI